MHSDLIIDVGMCTGEDTAFYLAKGFRVASIEANPDLVEAAKQKFSDFIRRGRLTLFSCAISTTAEPVEFWVNPQKPDWGTANPEFVERNTKFGSPHQKVVVPGRTFGSILDETGTPYYLKIDAEGADRLCLDALRGREAPTYISMEGELNDFDGAFGEISTLWGLGYRKFKLVNQGLNHLVRCPNPPLEGAYVDARFNGYSSGPFAEEAPGKWMGQMEILRMIRRLQRDQELCGMNGPFYGTIPGRIYMKARRLMGSPVAWWDIHAKLN